MKRHLLLILTALLPLVAFAYDIAVENADGKIIYYNYINNGTELEVASSSTYKGVVVIPEEVTYMNRTRKVTSIGFYAFYNCTSLTSVTIPSSVTSIGSYAFQYCSSLTSVTIPNSVTSIGNYAFDGTGWYNAQPDGILYLDNWLLGYKGTKPTGDITINSGTRGIAVYAFRDCSGLTSVTIPNSVTSIGYFAFYFCSGLTSITIPNSVTTIGESAFSNCSGLTSITIPNSVTSIGDYAFYGTGWYNAQPDGILYLNNWLLGYKGTEPTGDVTINNGTRGIAGFAFSNCSGLTSVTIPNSVTSIGDRAFSRCDGLTSIKVETGNTKYDSRNDCNAIIETATNTLIAGCQNTIIPNSVTSIGEEAFSWCTSLTSITIPNSVTSIGNYAFYLCSGLTSVTIPESVTSIGNNAFYYCSGLTEVYCYAENVPSTNSYAFEDSPISSAILHVPAASVEAYSTTAPWSDFGTIVGITYTLTYIVDGEVYKSYDVEYGAAITPEPEPTKEGYTFSGWSEIPETMPAHNVTVTGTFTKDKLGTCATPTISYVNGELKFNSETEGVTFHYNIDIEDDNVKSGISNVVQLSVTYHISVYATKEDYYDSEVATGTLCWIDQQPSTEGIVNEDAVTEVKALPVLIQSNRGTITVQGANEGTEIMVYSVNGMKLGSAIATQGLATISTSLQPGSTAIVKIGEKAIKVLIR